MIGRTSRHLGIRWTCALALAGLFNTSTFGQEPEFRTGGGSEYRSGGPGPVTPTEGMTRLPRNAYPGEPTVGIPQRTLFRDTGAPYLNNLRTPAVQPSVQADSVDATFRFDIPDVSANFPLLTRGFEPEDADLKLGPAYFKLRALGLGLLASDNIELSESDRDEGVIGIVRLSGSVLVQLTEGFRIAASGTFVYLPFEGKAGIAGFNVLAPLSFTMGAVPALQSQIAWDTMIAGWPVLFADEFRTGIGRYSISSRDDFELFEGGDFDEQDRAGRYVFRAPRTPDGTNRNKFRSRDSEFIYFGNTVSAATDRLLPGETRLRARVYHQNLWYNQGRRGLPDLRQGARVTLSSERDNLRFKPFISYSAFRSDLDDSFDHSVRLGIQGPITDQLDFFGSIGFHYSAERGISRVPWRISFIHDAGAYTQQSLSIGSELSDFNDEFYSRVTYRLRQILGPNLTGEAFATYGYVEDMLGEFDDREEFRAGVRIGAVLGPRTRLNLAGIYAHIDTGRDFGTSETWTGRMDLAYRFTDTLLGRLLYQYQQRDSDREGDSYYENLLYLTVTKYFP